jgi:hypothetical protein
MSIVLNLGRTHFVGEAAPLTDGGAVRRASGNSSGNARPTTFKS